ncbi:MAG: ribosome maturation factor RimP, partial [Actinomycetota bacterium]
MTMTGDSPLVSRLTDVVLPIVSDLGLDLYDLEFSGGLLRITVDTPPGSPGGVDVDQLSRVTRLVSRELDHLDPIPGHYTLEVSSPGLERNLRLPRHFAREVGKTVAVRLRNVVQGERRVTGILVEAGSEAFTVRQESGAERVVPYLDVDRARTVFVWEARPKPGQSKS